MLTTTDIELMAEWQDEIYTLRERPITVIYSEKVYDNITGELIGDQKIPREVSAVVTELSTRGADGSRYLEGGIEYKQGDIKLDIKIDSIEDIADVIERVKYGGKDYELLGDDRKGIGKRNRYEFIGRVIA